MLPKIFTIDLRAPNPCPAYIPPTLIKQGKYCCIPSFSALLPKRVSGLSEIRKRVKNMADSVFKTSFAFFVVQTGGAVLQ